MGQSVCKKPERPALWWVMCLGPRKGLMARGVDWETRANPKHSRFHVKKLPRIYVIING